MNVESIINSSSLEKTFRALVKQYRALLRWGVDKVFQDSRIDNMFIDARHLIDDREASKASKLLTDLKKQIHLLENQYPDQKNEIEKELFSRIQQLETIIDKSSGVNVDEAHTFLQTLEIARVAMQNDDWSEAKSRIETVEEQILTTQIIEQTIPQPSPTSQIKTNTVEDTNTVVLKKSADTPETKTNEDNDKKTVVKNANEKTTGNKSINSTEKKQETPILDEKISGRKKPAQQAPEKNTLKAKLDGKKDDLKTSEDAIQNTSVKNNEKSKESSKDKNREKEKEKEKDKPLLPSSLEASLNTTAKALYTTANRSAVGRLISLQDLQKTFNTLDNSDIQNIRIGFYASADTLNAELAPLSRIAINVKETGIQVALLRLSISRDLAIYLVGIPINENTNFDQLNKIVSQCDSSFVNASRINKKNVKKLSDALPEILKINPHLYIKDDPNTETGEIILTEDVSQADSKYTFIEDQKSRFVEDAAINLEKYSKY